MAKESIIRALPPSDDVRLYLNGIEERSTKPLPGRILEEASFVVTRRRVATPVDWLFAPDWLTIEEACELSGWDPESLQEIVDEGGVDLNDAGLIHKQSLYEFQETLAEALHWDDDG